MTPPTPLEDAHHSDNQRRFIVLETKIDDNTAMTKQLASDTGDLLAMWRDVGIVFQWLRHLGAAIVWVRNVALAIAALYVLWRYGSGDKP